MTLGLSLPTFTMFHVVLSLIGIASGLLVITEMLRSRISSMWSAVFLITTLATVLTGFLFPVEKILPSHIVGILTAVALLLAIAALYVFKLRGPWRGTYVVSAVVALYFNVFVAIVQSFEKIAVLHEIAPTQSAPAFKIVQLTALALFLLLGVLAFRKTRVVAPESVKV